MRLENFFANDKLKLATLINAYIDYKKMSELNQVFPFNKFLIDTSAKCTKSGKDCSFFSATNLKSYCYLV